MKIKKEYFILAAVIVALSAYLSMHRSNRTNYRLPEPPAVNKNDISKIEITTGKSSLTLEKKDGRWVIAPKDYAASESKVTPMLDALAKLSLTALVSEAKDYQRYDLNPDKRITVKAWAEGKPVRELEVGKVASSYRHTFVKLAGNDRVYQANGSFHGTFDQTLDSLRDKSVLSVPEAKIKSITIAQQDATLEFHKKTPPPEAKEGKQQEKKPQWELADGQAADPGAIGQILSTLSNLQCASFVDGKTKDDFKKPIYAVTLKGDKEYQLNIHEKMNKEDKKYPAVSSDNPYPFFLPEWRVKDIMKKPDQLIAKSNKEEQQPNKEK